MAGPRCDRNHPLHVQHAGVPPLQVREHLLGDQHGQQLRSAADVLNDGQHVQGQNELGIDRDEAEPIWNLIDSTELVFYLTFLVRAVIQTSLHKNDVISL